MNERPLTLDFVAHAARRGRSLRPPADLEARLLDCLESGRRAWSNLRVPARTFVRWLAERVPDNCDLAAIYGNDGYLVCGLLDGDPRALEHFERAFLSAVPRHIGHIRASNELVDEVCQQLRTRLLVPDGTGAPGRIAEYAGRGPLGALVRIAAVRAALNLLRRGGADLGNASEDDAFELPSTGHDPELDCIKAEHRAEFKSAFAQAVRALPPEDRNLLRLHHLDGLTVDQISVACRVHRSSVGRRLIKVRDQVLADTRRRLAERLNLQPSELSSLIGAAQSQFELSMNSLFQPANE
jgi:RNA polymerase sigma-70 factor (ECF subfamily)